MQTLGLTIIGFILALASQVAFIIGHPGATQSEITAFASGLGLNFGLNAAGYILVLAGFLLMFGVRRKFGELFRSFRSYKGFLAGAIGGIAIIGATYLYGFIINSIFLAAGMPIPGPNQNEQTIRKMVTAFPALCLIVFGLIGPFTEEIGYRVGIFGFFSRLGKWAAYLLSALIFGLVHFDVTILFDASAQSRAAIELANLPSYIGAGLGLAFLYDRFGLSASYTAHTLNNVFSLVYTLVESQNA